MKRLKEYWNNLSTIGKVSTVIGGVVIFIVCCFWAFNIYLRYELKTLLAEHKKQGYITTIEERYSQYPHIPDAENGAIFYKKAFALRSYVSSSLFKNKIKLSQGESITDLLIVIGQGPKVYFDTKLTKKQRDVAELYLKNNESCFTMIKKATALQKCIFSKNFNIFSIPLSDISKTCDLQLLLGLKETLDVMKNNQKETFLDLRMMLSVVHSLDKEPYLISKLVQFKHFVRFKKYFEYALTHFTFREEQLQELDDGLNYNLNVGKIFNNEILYFISLLKQSKNILSTCERLDWEPFSRLERFLFKMSNTLLDLRVLYQINALKSFNKYLVPFDIKNYLRQKEEKRKTPEERYIQKLKLILNRGLNIERPKQIIYFIAIADITKLTIAVEQYRLKYHKLPETLDELKPEFIKEMLLDPFQGYKPYKYHIGDIYEYNESDSMKNVSKTFNNGESSLFRKYSGYCIYSFGENGVDDAGLQHYSKGDIVFNRVLNKKELKQ